MTVHLKSLSPKEEQAVKDIRTRLAQIEDEETRKYAGVKCEDDSIILRFLRARSFDVDQAFDMLYSTLRFRITFQGIGIDSVTPQMMLNELKHGKSFFHKFDKDGRPVCIIRARFQDASQIDPLEAQRFCVYMMEYGRTLLPPGVETVTLIFDMLDSSTKNLDLKSLRFMIQMLQNHYPESVGKILIFNAPWFLWGSWKLIRPWLDPVTAAKVTFTDPQDIMNHVHPEDLLEEYGGTDSYKYDCGTFIDQLEKVMLPAQ